MDGGQATAWLLRDGGRLWHLRSAALVSFASPPEREVVGREMVFRRREEEKNIVQEAKMASEV